MSGVKAERSLKAEDEGFITSRQESSVAVVSLCVSSVLNLILARRSDCDACADPDWRDLAFALDSLRGTSYSYSKCHQYSSQQHIWTPSCLDSLERELSSVDGPYRPSTWEGRTQH